MAVRKLFLSAPNDTQANLQTSEQVSLFLTQDKLEKNTVHQWVEQQKLDQEFAENYGIMNREAHLDTEISKLETALDKMKSYSLGDNQLMRPASFGFGSAWGIGEFYGSQWISIAMVKEKLIELRAGKLGDHYWSPNYMNGRYYYGRHIPHTGDDQLNTLHHWLKANGVNHTARQSSAYQSKLKQLKAREAVVTAQRRSAWSAQQTETLRGKFSAEEIAAYENLREQIVTHTEQSQVLEEAAEIAQAKFVSAVQTKNTTRRQAVAAQNLLQPFTPDEFTEISAEFGAQSLTLPAHLENVYFEAYRRFQNDKLAFADEVDRLSEQSKASDRRKKIATRHIPAEPAMTKEVRDYLSDPERTATDIDRDIKEVQDGIPKLADLYANNPSYLATATKNAHAKIAALERYKALGPVATAKYQADLAAYKETHAPVLAAIETELAAKYDNATQYVANYWQAAGQLLAKRTAENAYKPTDPSQVELVETHEEVLARETAEKAQIEAIVQEYLAPADTAPTLNVAYRAAQEAVEKEAALKQDLGKALTTANIKSLEDFKSESKFKLFWESFEESSYKVWSGQLETLQKAGSKNADSLWAYAQGDQKFVKTVWQQLGNTLGGIADFSGTASGQLFEESIKALGFDDELQELILSALGTEIGQLALVKLSEGGAAWEIFEKENPAIARDIKAILGTVNFTAALTGAKLGQQAMATAKTRLKSAAAQGITVARLAAKEATEILKQLLIKIDDNLKAGRFSTGQLLDDLNRLGLAPQPVQGNWAHLLSQKDTNGLDGAINSLNQLKNQLNDAELSKSVDDVTQKLSQVQKSVGGGAAGGGTLLLKSLLIFEQKWKLELIML